ncbi:DUF421 domain-containing protein [Fictibacillus iocasae]|uniref:DUF421 domain-containing protein n=1 Tax=Fictibacillus iocasae TaxID=2715437 RepID=A0ABW2NMR0_9BACL
MEDMIHTAARTTASYLLLLILTYFIGKQINAHKNYFSFALSITIGALVANMGFNVKIPFTDVLLSFMVLSSIYFLVSYLSLHFRPLRKWLSGSPTTVIENGQILEHHMKKIHLTMDDLNQLLREASIFDIEEVDYAVLEISGNLSVLKKDLYKNVTKRDLKLPESAPKPLPLELIMDGSVLEQNLNDIHNRTWLNQQLTSRGLTLSDVFYAVVSSNGTLILDLYQDNPST